MQFIQAFMEDGEGKRLGAMPLPAGTIPNVGDRITYFDDKMVLRQRDVVRGRHFVQSIHSPGVVVKLFVMTEAEVLEEASRVD